MDDDANPKPPGLGKGLILLICVVLFAALLGARDLVDQVWVRMLLAAGAGAVLGWALLQVQKTHHR
jgi:hypothetical protein